MDTKKGKDDEVYQVQAINALEDGQLIELENDPDDDLGEITVMFHSVDWETGTMTVSTYEDGIFEVGCEQFKKAGIKWI